jgi:DNA mismatch endonuclease, patch repair protein
VADIFTAKKRSQIMSRIRSSGTKPEEKLFQLLRELLGKRRRIERNVRTLPGQPDIVIPSLRLAVFVDGCFYHGCPEHGHNPKTNKSYWIPKLARNQARDKKNRKALRRMGFAVWRIWEHSLRGSQFHIAQARLARQLAKRVSEVTGP